MSTPGPQIASPESPRSRKRVIIALIMAFVVLVALVLIYALISQPTSPNQCRCSDPCFAIDLDNPRLGGGTSNRTAEMTVASVECPFVKPFSAWKALLYRDGAPLATSPQTLAGNTTISFGANTRLIVYDTRGDGQLSPGDRFLIYGMTGGHIWRLQLYLTGSDLLYARGWST